MEKHSFQHGDGGINEERVAYSRLPGCDSMALNVSLPSGALYPLPCFLKLSARFPTKVCVLCFH